MMSLDDMQSETKYEKEDPATSDSCEDMCGGHLMPFFIQSLQIPSEEQYLEIAIRSLPKGLSIRPTSVPGGQYGIWSDFFIPKGIKFGPYDAAADQLNISQRDAYISNDGIECSWFRYVNCAPSKDQTNLITIENGQKIYYCTSKQISCDEELLSWNDDNCIETGIIKKEVDVAEVIDINNEERDTSLLSSYDEATQLKMQMVERSMYQSSDRGTRDTGFTVKQNLGVLSVWSKDAVYLLIKKYKELDQKLFYRLKDKWKAISAALQLNGYHLSAEDCDQKWRNLKKTYRLVKHNRENTGKGRLTWEYFDVMREVLQSDTFSNTVANSISQNRTDTSSSRVQHPRNETPLPLEKSLNETPLTLEKSANSQKLVRETLINSIVSTDMSEKSNESNKPATKLWRKKLYSAPPLWFKKLEEERREEKKQLFEMLDKMHSDMVEVMERRNNILQKLVDMLESRKSDSD